MAVKIDLDEMERTASAATQDQWRWGTGGEDGRVNCLYASDPRIPCIPVIALDIGSQYMTLASDTEHIAANSPPVTLALIARIRELEAGLTELVDELVQSSEDPDGDYGDVRALVAKGTVLP